MKFTAPPQLADDVRVEGEDDEGADTEDQDHRSASSIFSQKRVPSLRA